jgi:anti-sigma factor RsiW
MALNIMAQCDDVAPLLGAFEDGELPPHEMQEVARHLASCAGCEETLAGYSNIGQLLRDAAPAPALDGFALAVRARIEQLRPPLRVRLGRWFETQRERFGSGVAVALAMAAAAMLTVVITTPFARNMVGTGNHVTQVAMRDARALARDTASSSAKSSEAIASAMRGEPSTIISKLESSNPDVAVWSEPSQGTTVIWLPDQQH